MGLRQNWAYSVTALLLLEVKEVISDLKAVLPER